MFAPVRPLFIAIVAALFLAGYSVPGRAGETIEHAQIRVEAALRTMLLTVRPGEDGLVTVFDGNKYVQCRHAATGSLVCEAAGTVLQPSLETVLTPERRDRLAALGWRVDDSFGNYVQDFSANVGSSRLAPLLIETLAAGYGANIADLATRNNWIPSEPCPPRNGFTQNLAGMINDAPEMAAVSIHACSYTPEPLKPPPPLAAEIPRGTAIDLIRIYGARVTREISRLRSEVDDTSGHWAFAIFSAENGYVQCEAQPPNRTIACEAASAESVPALAPILTPDRVARLHAAGFDDPGRAQNYRREYSVASSNDAAIAAALLEILHYVYGYNGEPPLELTTEAGRKETL